MRSRSPALRRAAAFVLALLLAVPTAYAAAGQPVLQTSTQIVDGLTYRNTITVDQDRRIESFSLELSPDSSAQPILIQGSGTIYGTATINKAVSTAQEKGYHVLGAVNTDFFSTATGMPLGISIEDGTYQSSPGSENAILITDGQVSLLPAPKVELSLTNARTGQPLIPNFFNKVRTDSGGVYLLNDRFSTVSTRTSTPGWYIRMAPAQGQASAPLTVSSRLELEVVELLQSDQPIPIPAGEYILTAADASGYQEVFQSFQLGDRVTLETRCDSPELVQAQWACGAGDIMVADGQLTDSSTWTYAKDGRQPRTALGIKADGSVLVYAVDGRRPSWSSGLSQLDLAQEMLAQGCQWAINLDGGGSTALSVWLPGQGGAALQNKPSDGKPRGCATYLLLVTEQRGDGRASRLAWTQDGQTVLSGTSLPLPQTVALDQGLELVDQQLSDLRLSSQDGLGQIQDGRYLAGSHPGTDHIRLYDRSSGLEGQGQIHVVDHLTQFSISQAGSTSPITSLKVKPGEQIQLSASGSYWGRTALRDWEGVTWTTQGEIGTLSEDGLFTAPQTPASGSISFSAGGLEQTIQIGMDNLHLDVPQDHWAHQAVSYCYEHDIVTGISSTEFGRDHQIRRGDFILMLYNALGKPAPSASCTFQDVSPSDYYYTALSWGQGAGLASGTGEGSYSPQAPITREQAFTILRQALPLLGKDCPDGPLSTLDQFDDRGQIADYAAGHTATLVSQGLVSGKGTGVDPKGVLTRAEMAAILYKAMTYEPVLLPPVEPGPAEPAPVEPGPAEPAPVDPAPVDPVQPGQYALTLDLPKMELPSGAGAALTATLSPAPEGAKILWHSSDPSVAAVSPAGVVTNLHTGSTPATAQISASWQELTAHCTVTCAPAKRLGLVHDAQLGLNVRTGPGTEFPTSGSLANDSLVILLDQVGGWYQVLYLNAGQAATGFVSASYLTEVL